MMMKRRINKLSRGLFIILFLGALLFLSVQQLYSKNTGCKYFKNYSYRDYGYSPQNWMIAQDSRGVIYTANSFGVLEFDGVSWQFIRMPSLVFSLTIDEDDRIYLGGRNNIGVLTPDAKGAWQYRSLLDGLNDNYKNLPNVWPAYSVKDKIYFNSLNFLFQWDKKNNKMNVWEHRNPPVNVFGCGEKFFTYDDKVGIMQMIDGSLTPLAGGKAFAGKEVVMMVPYDNAGKTILIGTKLDGFYLYDGAKPVPFSTKASDYVRKNHLYYGVQLESSPGEFALATMQGGIVIIDSHGELKYIFNKSTGLQYNNVSHIFEDRQGNLWLALNKGISKLEYSSPLEVYDERLNLPGFVTSMIKHRGDLIVGTNSGLYFLSPLSTAGFQPVSGISDMCTTILFTGNFFLVGTNRGIFLVEHGQYDTKRKVFDAASIALCQSRRDNKRIWVGMVMGLSSLYINTKNGQLVEEKYFENTNADIRSIVEDPKGTLWLGTLMKGVIKVDFPTDIHHSVVTWYNTSHGLPKGVINVFFAAGHVMFATDKGIFRFDQTHNKFIPDSTLGDQFAGGGRSVQHIVEDQNKNIWFNSQGYNFQAIYQSEGPFLLNSTPFRRIPPGPTHIIYPDPDDNSVWFGGSDGLIRFDPGIKKNYHHDFTALIRRVQSISGKHTILQGNQANTTNNTGPSFLTLKYKYRNLHFEFAAPFFEDESRTTYQCFLESHDKDWSEWASATHVDYPDLDPGSYTFRVRAKNIYGHIGSEDVFRFNVLPPWSRTWWAFLGYALGFFLVIYLAVKWRSGKLEQEKLHLEQIIYQRTKEINQKNQQLEEMDKIKSRFFANISHEFRTPLTLIMGPLEQILSTYPDKELKKTARIMLRNSQRLLNLVNQLLELAKLDSGKMKFKPSLKNIVPVLKTIAASFESLAFQQKLELTVHSQKEDITLYFDADKLEKIIGNLLSNAVKFTPPGGKITISLKKNLARDTNFPSGSVDISVTDTGVGIPDSQLDHVFERFYQAGDSHEFQQKGSGIGLALAKELVKLHHGEILVLSSTGCEGKTSGTEFIVRLPLGTEHLKPEKIAPPSEETTTMSTVSTLSAARDTGKIQDQSIDSIEEEEERIEEPIIHEAVQEEKNIILVVEDSADMRNYIRGALGSLYRVKEAADGKQGIEKAKTIIPDLIISDIMMPGADGYELCRVLKEDMNTSHIPIILLTAKASEENVIQGLETGADDYITKPFNTNILTARIKNLIDLRKQLQLKRKRQMTLQPVEIPVSSVEEKFYKELQGTIEKNLSDPEFNVDRLHKKLYMGRTSLYRKILALTGETPTQFIRSFRLQRAAQLFKANFGNVTEVAFAVGFSNTAYFAKCFKEKFHQSPSYYHASEAREH